MTIHSVLLISPLVLVNAWHGFLLVFRKGDDRPQSISSHAAENPRYLMLHRIFHTLISMSLIAYALLYLRAELGLLLPVILLITGATMDIIEVMTLNENTPTGPDAKDVHQLTAWVMALSYLFFAISLAVYAEYSALVVNAIWIVFLIMITSAAKIKFRYFWAFQMSYFLMLSILIALTHLSISV